MAGFCLLLACTPSARPAPPTAPATPSAACVAAWRTALVSSPDGALDGPMRACRSLGEFAGGNAVARAGTNGIAPKVLAEVECRTVTFNDTPIVGRCSVGEAGRSGERREAVAWRGTDLPPRLDQRLDARPARHDPLIRRHASCASRGGGARQRMPRHRPQPQGHESDASLQCLLL